MVPEPRSAYALRFFLLATSLFVVAALIAFGLLRIFPQDPHVDSSRFSSAFIASTWLLLIGSGFLIQAVESVRRERQNPFRRSLMLALGSGVLFVSVQSYALIYLIHSRPGDDATTGASSFVAVIAALHAMHFIVALLFLCYITVQASADRYDHEYFWGVTIAAWFWHALGIVWLVILFVMLIARIYE